MTSNQIPKEEIINIMLKVIKIQLEEELEEIDSLDGHISNAKRVLTTKNLRIL